MSERYKKLYTLPENQYAEGSPVLISKGALLKDTQTGQILAQLKLRNINSKTIKAVKVKIDLLDTVGRPLKEETEFQFLDLNDKRDSFFGEKTPIYLENESVRSFSVAVKEVIFADKSIWNADDGAKWEVLPTAKKRKKLNDDLELERQFEIHYGKDRIYEAEKVNDLWYCACGALNRADEGNCHSCKRSFDECQSIDIDALKAEKDKRLEKEKAKAEADRIATEKKAEAERLEAEQKRIEEKKRKKKVAAIGIPAAVATLAIILLVTNLFIPLSKYNKAVNLTKNKDYSEAYKILLDIKGFKDVNELLKDFHYVPTAINIEGTEYSFEYNDQQFMISCKGDGNYYYFDDNGVLVSDINDGAYEYNSGNITYRQHNSDGSIEKRSYDSYGHCEKVSHLENWQDGGNHYEYKIYTDVHHNLIEKEIYSTKGWNPNGEYLHTVTYNNTYDTDGNLTHISRSTDGLATGKWEFEYEVLYSENHQRSSDEVIWRNIRMILYNL